MTQKKDNSTQKKHRSPWHWVFFIFCGLLVIFLLASYLLRTSLYLKVRLTPKLAEVGAMIHGHFEFEDVEHFIVENNDSLSVTWAVDGVECIMNANVPKEDIYTIIKSIYWSEFTS